MTDSPFSSQTSSTLPATQYNERTPTSRATKLWTSSIENTFRPPLTSQKRRNVRLFDDVVEEQGDEVVERRSDDADEDDIEVEAPAERNVGAIVQHSPPQSQPQASTQRRRDWKRPTFPSMSVPPERRTLSQRPTTMRSRDEGDEDDTQRPPPSTFVAPSLTARQWRVPLHRRVEESIAASQARLRLAAALESADMDAVDRQLANVEARDEELVAYDDDGLPRLHDTDDSEAEEEDDESIDAWEMKDHLRHRLRTGFAQLDQRLGLEARHAAAQYDDGIGDGLTSGGLLEVTGTPGCGKTTFLIQLAIKERLEALEQAADSQTPAARQVVIIDTEGSVSPHRLAHMAQALIEEAVARWEAQGNIDAQRPSRETLLEHTLAGIYLTRCTTLGQLLATFEVLLPSSGEIIDTRAPTRDGDCVASQTPGAGAQHGKPARRIGLPDDTSLIVVDSLTHYFRAPPSDDRSKRLEHLHAVSCAQRFVSRAHAAAIKLIISKQMHSSFLTSDGQRTNPRDANALVTMKPMMLDWLDNSTAADAWCLLLYRIDIMSLDRAALIVARPASLRDGRDGGIVSDEAYWQTVMAYRIDDRGIMIDSPRARRARDCTTTGTE